MGPSAYASSFRMPRWRDAGFGGYLVEAEVTRLAGHKPDHRAYAVVAVSYPPGDDNQGLVSQSLASTACSARICASQSAPSAQAA